ncbi:MAG: serine/threonine-protein kinase [Sandaracinaceae bacterium]
MELVGSRFRGLSVHGELGRGGMGRAYLASHDVLKTPLVLKTFEAPVEGDLFREAHLAARVDSPHVVGVLDAGEEDGVLFVVQRYVDGIDLDELRDRIQATDGLLPTQAVIRMLLDVARGLGAIHRAGVVHRDIKPANLFLSGHGHALVGDFGIATDPFDGDAEHPAGTPAFIAPEIWCGAPAYPAADLYALGATAHLLATGTLPFAASDPAALRLAHTTQPYAPPPTTDPTRAYLFTVIASLLEKDPARRPPSAEALVRTLARIEEPAPPLTVSTDTRAESAGLTIELSWGDLATAGADVIVNAAHAGLSMDVGVAAALRDAAGVSVEADAMAAGPVSMGEVVWTGPGALDASHMAHAVAALDGAVCLQRATLRTLLGARSRGATSVAFPALGTGVGGVPHALAAALMLSASKTFASLGRGSVEHVRFVVYEQDALAVWSSVLRGM